MIDTFGTDFNYTHVVRDADIGYLIPFHVWGLNDGKKYRYKLIVSRNGEISFKSVAQWELRVDQNRLQNLLNGLVLQLRIDAEHTRLTPFAFLEQKYRVTISHFVEPTLAYFLNTVPETIDLILMNEHAQHASHVALRTTGTVWYCGLVFPAEGTYGCFGYLQYDASYGRWATINSPRIPDNLISLVLLRELRASQLEAKRLVEQNFVVLDVETTGLGADAEICELCVLDGVTGKPLFDRLIRPTKSIPDDVIKVHGISNEMVAEAPYFKDVSDELMSVLSGRTIVAHFAEFDAKRLTFELGRCGLKSDNKWSCSMALSTLNHERWLSLSKACNRFGVSLNGVAHRANYDAECARQLILKIAG